MRQPNILIFMTDHQRADTVLKDSPCLTPNMDKFLTESVNFTHTYCPTAHCCPARATFMSGLYPSRSGVWNNVNNDYAINRGPFDDVKMFSEDLREQGYDLAYIGKWHVSALGSQTPAAYGWRELQKYTEHIQSGAAQWEQIRAAANAPAPAKRPGLIAVEGYHPHCLYSVQENANRMDENSVANGIAALKEMAANESPWCLYIGTNAPHTPYDVPQRYLDKYRREAIKLPPSYADTMEDKPDYYKKLRNIAFDQLSEEEARDAVLHYYAVCSRIDEWFGEVLAALAETGQGDNTLVMFCSDHGDYVGEHGLFHKQVPAFLGAYRIPMVVRWPAGISNPGREEDSFVSLADFAPTFLEMAGAKSDRYFTGSSLAPFFKGEKPADWRDEMCTQMEGTEQHFTQRMVITKQYKYVYNGFARDELYDLVNDPHEMRNIFNEKAMAAVIEDMAGRMWRFAYREQDHLGATQYIMVNTAPYGPMQAFRRGETIPPAAPNPNLGKRQGVNCEKRR